MHPKIRGGLKSGDSVAIIHIGDFLEHIKAVNQILELNKDLSDLLKPVKDILKDNPDSLKQLRIQRLKG